LQLINIIIIIIIIINITKRGVVYGKEKAIKTSGFLDRFPKNVLRISKFTKTRSVRADLFHAGGRTDGQRDRHDEANNSFS
jgi:hypothetical protein